MSQDQSQPPPTTEEPEWNEGSHFHVAMQPSIVQQNANDSIPIYDGDLQVIVNGTATTEKGRITYSFVPSPMVLFELPSPTAPHAWGEDELQLRLPGANANVDVIVTNSGVTFGQNSQIASISGFVKSPICYGLTERLGRVRFHLLNFHRYQGERIFRGEGYRNWPGRVKFDFGPWRVTLDALQDVDNRLKQAEATSGYIITHVGNLEQRDLRNGVPKLFGAKEASKALDILYYVFSFARGARCPCILSFGYRHDPLNVRCVQAIKAASAAYNGSWFALNNPLGSFGFADNMYKLWQDENERGWLISAISLYVESNRNLSGVDIELAKSQIALELLAWESVQERQQLISRDTFDKLPAADKVRLALLWAGIPTEIPAGMNELRAAIPLLNEGESSPYDGPFAITQIRNATIHATRAKRKRMSALNNIARYQAWQLSQHYVELLILRLLNYQGPYLPHYRDSLEDNSTVRANLTGPRLWYLVPWVSPNQQ